MILVLRGGGEIRMRRSPESPRCCPTKYLYARAVAIEALRGLADGIGAVD